MKIFSKVCSILSTLIIIAFAVIAGLLIIPMLFGCKNMAVLSGSMEPGIAVGSVVFVKETDAESIKPGDVITYKLSGGTMVTHRVVSVDSENKELITKGDANEVEDGSPVAFSAVVGREVFHVPLLGYLTIYIRTPIGIIAVCGVLIVLILLNFLPGVLQPEEEKKEEKKEE